MNIQIGQLEFIPPRQAFPHEARHFTHWLANNLDHLGRVLNMDLVLVEVEKNYQGKRVDILCQDGHGNFVIIENQLEKTDDDHLGRLIGYKSMARANTAIWIAPEFRSHHIQTIKDLNESTHSGFMLCLVKLEVIRIDGSRPVPIFTPLISLGQAEAIAELEKFAVSEADTPEAESEAPVIQNPVLIDLPPIWALFPRRDIETYRLFLHKKYFGLGFAHGVGDPRSLANNRTAFRAAFQKGSGKNRSEKSVHTLADMVYRLVHEVKVGDIVLYAPTWKERKIYLGEVVSDYIYEPWQAEGYDIMRKVKWLYEFDRDEFSRPALNGITVTLALFQVRNQAFLAELAAKLNP
jgi:hypothetical protein